MAGSYKTIALPCVCALALGCLVSLLVPPDGALAEEAQLQQSPEPRMANWFANISKYMEKLFSSSSKKPPNKKPSNSTKTTPWSTTAHLYLNVPNPTNAKHQRPPSTGTPQAPAIKLLPRLQPGP